MSAAASLPFRYGRRTALDASANLMRAYKGSSDSLHTELLEAFDIPPGIIE